MKSSLQQKLAYLVLGCLTLSACEQQQSSELQAKLSGYDAKLDHMPHSFYEPGMGDLMHGLQLRHAKLWYAAKAGNWALAQFELHELRENLDRVARWHPEEEGLPVEPAIAAHMHPGAQALEQSIDRKDGVTFQSAFDRFTHGCNSCHQATRHGFIVIRRPSVEPVSNQQWEQME